MRKDRAQGLPGPFLVALSNGLRDAVWAPCAASMLDRGETDSGQPDSHSGAVARRGSVRPRPASSRRGACIRGRAVDTHLAGRVDVARAKAESVCCAWGTARHTAGRARQSDSRDRGLVPDDLARFRHIEHPTAVLVAPENGPVFPSVFRTFQLLRPLPPKLYGPLLWRHVASARDRVSVGTLSARCRLTVTCTILDSVPGLSVRSYFAAAIRRECAASRLPRSGKPGVRAQRRQ